jgi:hypothetical protein
MHEFGSLPRARQDGLLEEAAGEELLLYDQERHIAHCLSPVAACVWRHCDGEHDIAELAQLAGASESLVGDALQALREKDLLAAEPVSMQDAVPGESRREAIGRVVRYGAAAAAGSMIVSATAATPAMASTIISMCKASDTEACCQCEEADGSQLCKSEAETMLTEAACKKYCKEEPGRVFLNYGKLSKCS